MSAESNLITLREESQAWKQLKAERDELLVCIKGILGALDQPITRRLRKENSIFHGDICVIEHFAKAAIEKCKGS